MENKYYTPTIDEFYVGFRFEVLNNEIWEWQHMNASRLQEINFDDNTDNMSKYRVKYLDKTDIESLGFEEVNDVEVCNLFKTITLHSDEDTKYYIKYLDEHKLIKCYISIYQEHSVRIVKELLNKYNPRQVFQGIVKNKSELVKLLKMLGINE